MGQAALRPVQFAEESTWAKHRRQIAAFSRLKSGWDSYDAEPPSDIAIRNARRFLRVLEDLRIAPNWAEPTSDNSILIEVSVNGVLQEWDFYSDGDVAVLAEQAGRRDECHMVKPEFWEMMRYLTHFVHEPQ